MVVHVEDNMVMLQCRHVMSSVSVSVSNVWLQMTHVCCFFMWTPIHCPSIMLSLISSDVKLTFVSSFFSMMVASLVLKYFTSSETLVVRPLKRYSFNLVDDFLPLNKFDAVSLISFDTINLKIFFPFLSMACLFFSCLLITLAWTSMFLYRSGERACLTVSRDEAISALYSKCVDVDEIFTCFRILYWSWLLEKLVLELLLMPQIFTGDFCWYACCKLTLLGGSKQIAQTFLSFSVWTRQSK